MLTQLRQAPDRISRGLKLFSESNRPRVKFFGLSLIRESFRVYEGINMDEVTQLRIYFISWLMENINKLCQVESFLLNNLISIIVHAIKREYPEVWPSAFNDLLLFGKENLTTLNFVIRTLFEIDTEVAS